MKTVLNRCMSVRVSLLASLALCATSLRAVDIDYVWIGASGGSWTDSANWERADGVANTSYPQPGDSAIFMPGDGVSLAVSGSATWRE